MKKSAYKNFKTLSEFTAAIREAEEYQVLDKMTGVYRRPNARECRRIALELVPKESYFQTQIIHYLAQLPKAVFWKEQSGFGFQINGLPDICGVISGRFYGFEVKRPLIGKLSLIQQARMESIRRAGGVCEVVSYVEDVKKVLAREGVLS